MRRERRACERTSVRLTTRGVIPSDWDGHFIILDDLELGGAATGRVLHCLRMSASGVYECRERDGVAHCLAELGGRPRAMALADVISSSGDIAAALAHDGERPIGAHTVLAHGQVLLRRRRDASLEWRTFATRGALGRAGIVRVDPARVVTQAIVTDGHVLAMTRERTRAWSSSAPLHHVGVAPIADAAYAAWFACPEDAWTSMVQAHDAELPTVDLVSRRERDGAHGRLVRVTLGAREGSAKKHALYEGPLGRPSPREDRHGASYRYLYWLAAPGVHAQGASVVRFDVGARVLSAVSTSFARSVGRLTVVPASGRAHADEAAHVLAIVYDAASDASELWVVSSDEAGELTSGWVRLSITLRRPTRGLWLPARDEPAR